MVVKKQEGSAGVGGVVIMSRETQKIKVTDLDTGESQVYDYSSNNWRRQYACMRNGLVYMWVPAPLPSDGKYMITDGRRWELVSSDSPVKE